MIKSRTIFCRKETFFAMLSLTCAIDIQAQKPNVVFILADDLGYGDLGCYGNNTIKTPNIDRLAGEGVRFTQAYAGASVSSPSRCCLMTGLHTGHARIRGNMCRVGGLAGEREGMGTVRRTNLQSSDITFANVLSEHGYVTCLVNKWHLDGFDPTAGPLDRGFKEFYGWLIREPRSHNFYPDIRYRNREEYKIPENAAGAHTDHNTDRSTREAIDFIQNHKNDPFFLYLAYNAPHVPLNAKEQGIYATMNLTENDKNYAALVTHMDECIGRVIQALKNNGVENNTIIIFASDNGGAKAAKLENLPPINGILCGWKGELYEGGLRVPLIVRMPENTNAGKTSTYPCYFPDLFKTFADMVGVHTTVPTDGQSLLPEIQKPGSQPTDRFLYWEQFPNKGISQAVRWGKWKLIRRNIDQSFELYDLHADERETTNVADKHSGVVRTMADYMKEAHTESENWPTVI